MVNTPPPGPTGTTAQQQNAFNAQALQQQLQALQNQVQQLQHHQLPNPAQQPNNISAIQIAKILENRVTKFSGDGEEIFSVWLTKLTDVLQTFGIVRFNHR